MAAVLMRHHRRGSISVAEAISKLEERPMKRINLAPISKLYLVTAALLTGWLTASALAQNSNQSIVDDWTHHHVIFSNPGTREEAMRNGKLQQWDSIVKHPRYRMQQMRRGLPMAGQTATPTPASPRVQANPADLNRDKKRAVGEFSQWGLVAASWSQCQHRHVPGKIHLRCKCHAELHD